MPVCKNLFWRGYGARAFTPMLFAAFAINFAQAEDMKDMGDMKGMDHSQIKGMDHMQHGEPKSKDKDSKKAKTPSGKKSEHAGHSKKAGHGKMKMDIAGMKHENMKHEGHDMSGHAGMEHGMEMAGFLGPYSMNREGSGTSWLPDATLHEGVHSSVGDWMFMGHALVNGVYDSQGGPRGGDKVLRARHVHGHGAKAV